MKRAKHAQNSKLTIQNSKLMKIQPADRLSLVQEYYFSRKLKADVFIDDRNLGGLPDWGQIYNMIQKRQTWEDIINESSFDVKREQPKRKKKWGIF